MARPQYHTAIHIDSSSGLRSDRKQRDHGGLDRGALDWHMSEWKTRITKVQVVKPAKEAGEACLVLIYPPGPDMGKRFALQRSEIVLGRGADCDIQVDRDSVSRRHARVYRTGEQWSVEDLQSTNGSYVNDVPVTQAVLRDADFLKIGAAIFKFLSGSGIEASYH